MYGAAHRRALAPVAQTWYRSRRSPMASLYPRGNTWWITWRPRGERRQRRSTGLPLEDRIGAEEALSRVAEIERRHARVAPGLMPLGRLIDDWLAAKKLEVEAKTHTGYRTHVAHFRRLLPVGRPADALRGEHVRTYLQARRDEGAHPHTCNHERTTLAAIYNWAAANEITERNPVRSTRPMPLPRDGPRREPCPPELRLAVVNELREWAEAGGPSAHNAALVADLVEVLYWSGWRIGEACDLRAADVSLEGRSCPLKSAPHKGRRASWPVADEAWPIVEARTRVALEREEAKAETGRWVFALADGSHALNGVRLFVQRVQRRLPAFRAFGFHRLRHSFTTDSELAGQAAANLSRHSSERARELYLHVPDAAIREAQRRLARFRLRAARRESGAKKRSRRPSR